MIQTITVCDFVARTDAGEKFKYLRSVVRNGKRLWVYVDDCGEELGVVVGGEL